ncbi:hypothetical protein K7432_010195 [Basidiobolus ranarum]|uniref:Uncharacterized protein n=1 Tax=Basidiobolus ranarum TaxID=34480 RepID=A0ABR2VVV0_9FUNG
MKLASILIPLATAVGTVMAATSCLPSLNSTSTCEGADTYNLCRTNALAKFCEATDALCHCMQAKEFVYCTQYCRNDPAVTSALNTCQMAEQENQCKGIPLESQTNAVASPTVTSPGSKSNPTSNILSGSNGLTVLSSGNVVLVSGVLIALLL